MQPRQRERAASQAQIREIATRLDPERLGYSAEADRGAPIVGPDKMVESGNGRVAALRQVLSSSTRQGNAYKTWLKSQGVDVAKYKEPILVRQRLSDMDQEERQGFTVAANQAATLAMAAPERAMADAKTISRACSILLKDEDLNDLRTASLLAPLLANCQRPSAARYPRKRAVYQPKASTPRPQRDPRESVWRPGHHCADHRSDRRRRKVGFERAGCWRAGMGEAAGDIEAGSVPEEFDVTPELIEAVKRTADLRGNGRSSKTTLRRATPLTKYNLDVDGFIRAFYDPNTERAKSTTRIADFLRHVRQRSRANNRPRPGSARHTKGNAL